MSLPFLCQPIGHLLNKLVNATSLDLGVDACCLSFEDEIADAVMEILGDEEDEP